MLISNLLVLNDLSNGGSCHIERNYTVDEIPTSIAVKASITYQNLINAKYSSGFVLIGAIMPNVHASHIGKSACYVQVMAHANYVENRKVKLATNMTKSLVVAFTVLSST